jgi:hypothetical protein
MLNNVAKLVKELGPTFKDITKLVNHIGGEIYKSVPNIEKDLLNLTPDQIEELQLMAKIAWSYEEKNTSSFALNDAVSWFKANMPKEIKEGCILLNKRSPTFELHLCFMKENEPLLDGGFPHLVVKTIEIDSNLQDRFSRTDMILIN